MNSPTQIPVFKQTRPPLEVSVKHDHLLIEKVVNHRQVSVLSGSKRKTPSYSSSSGSYSIPTPAAPSPQSRNGNGNGNGNGSGNGNGQNGGNGHESSASSYSSSQAKIDEPPKNLQASKNTGSTQEKKQKTTSHSADTQSPSLNEFGSFSIEESSDNQSSSLMSAFSEKGLVKENPEKTEENKQSKPDAIGTAEDWAGSTGESLNKVEAKNSTQEGPSQNIQEKPLQSNEKSDLKTTFLAKGIAGSAVSIAIGSTVAKGLAQATKRPDKPKETEITGSDQADSSVEQVTEKEPIQDITDTDIPKAQPINPNVQKGISISTASKSNSGAFSMPTEVKTSGEVLVSESTSSTKESIESAKAEPPILSPEQIEVRVDTDENTVAEAETETETETAPTETETAIAPTPPTPLTAPTPIQPIATDTKPSTVNIASTASPVSTASSNFDFSEQFGTDFNPEDFFGGNQAEPEVGVEFENFPIDNPAANDSSKSAVTDKESEVSDNSSQSPIASDDGDQARQEVIDFFGDSQDSVSNAQESVSSSAVVQGSSSAAENSDGFDFFDNASNSTTQLEKPYVQESHAVQETSNITLQENDQGAKTQIVTDDDDAQKPLVAMPKGVKTKTAETDFKPDPSADGTEDGETSSESSDTTSESDSETITSAPKRRSFSGGSITPKKAKPKNSDDDDIEDDEEDDDDDSDSKLNWLEQDVNVGSLNVSRQTAIIIAAVGAFILIQIPGWVMAFAGALTGGGGGQQVANRPQQQQQQQQLGQRPGMRSGGTKNKSILSMARTKHLNRQAPNPVPGGGAQPAAMGGQQANTGGPLTVAGTWVVNVFTNKNTYKSNIVISQSGNNFNGTGVDGYGSFGVSGNFIQPDKLVFNKSYSAEAKKRGALTSVIAFSGQLGRNQGQIFAKGIYESQTKVGYESSTKNPARMVPISGKWSGALVKPPTADQTKSPGMFDGIAKMFSGNQAPQIAEKPQQNAPDFNHVKPTDLHDMFLKVALGLVGVGVCIFAFFLFLFGPSGWMNIWEKKKYIPSQFKSQHLKMVRDLGKPLVAGSTPLGTRIEWNIFFFWRPKYLSLPPEHREKNPHMLFLGGSDKGKTRLMASMITHDIKSDDRAVVVIDSDGQLADLIIEWISAEPEGKKYAKRVVLVDPTYDAGSLAYNPLEMPEDGDLQSAASAIVHGFKAIYSEPPGQQGGGQNQWNQQTANILRNASLLLMANGRTLTDLPNLLQDNDFRDIMLETVERRRAEKTEYINIIDTWNQYKKLARTDQWINWVEPILNRVGPMLGDGRIRPILTKPVSDLKLQEIILQKKILIVKIPQGELDQNANLLGSLMVTGLQQAAMALQKQTPYAVRPCSLFLDDLDSFIEKETVEQLCAETKRYQIGFVGSIKTLQHLPEDFKSQLIINVGTMCVFALAKKDGDMLGPQMFRVDGRKIKHQTITNFFNKVNTSPQFELIMDEEKLNIDRIVGQEEQTFFCYRVGTVAGVFKLKAHDFKDIPRKKLDTKLIEKMHAVTDTFGDSSKSN